MTERPHAETPTHGARFLLDRAATSETEATYRAMVVPPDGQPRHFSVLLVPEGPPTVQQVEGEPVAPWMHKHVEGLARALSSSGFASGAWPWRIRRWKEAPGGTTTKTEAP